MFIKIVLIEKVDMSCYLKGICFMFIEINYDKNGKVNGEYNKDLKE